MLFFDKKSKTDKLYSLKADCFQGFAVVEIGLINIIRGRLTFCKDLR